MGNSVLSAVTLFPLYAASVVIRPERGLANRERDLTMAWTWSGGRGWDMLCSLQWSLLSTVSYGSSLVTRTSVPRAVGSGVIAWIWVVPDFPYFVERLVPLRLPSSGKRGSTKRSIASEKLRDGSYFTSR